MCSLWSENMVYERIFSRSYLNYSEKLIILRSGFLQERIRILFKDGNTTFKKLKQYLLEIKFEKFVGKHLPT